MLGSNNNSGGGDSDSGSSSNYSRVSENSIPQGIVANEADDLPF